MADQLTLIKIPNMLRPDSRKILRGAYPGPVAISDALADFIAELKSEGWDELVITRNGVIIEDLSETARPGDYLAVSPKHGYFLVPVIIMLLAKLGVTGLVAGLAAYAICTALMVGVGLLINSFMGKPKTGAGKTDSQTYGFQGVNPVEAGYPVPVVYGYTRSTPQVLASYRTVDTDYTMWQWILFAASAGETNNPITANDIMVGDEYLVSLANYAFDTTDGSMNPSGTNLEYFDKVFHDRASFSRVLKYQIDFSVETLGVVDSVRLLFEFPAGIFKVNSSGGIDGTTVTFQLYYIDSNGNTGTPFSISVYGGQTTPVREIYHFNLPYRDKYTICMARTTEDDEDRNTKIKTTSTFIGMIEVINHQQFYPGIQAVTVGVKATDNASGQIPTIRIVHERTSISVIDWDGVGTMVVNPTNPAWTAYDCLTNSKIGMGISPTHINQTAWQEWIDWCDGLVDGNHRAECHIVFDEKGNFYEDCLSHIENVGRARILQYGDDWSVVVDKPKTPVYLFSSGNMIKDSFSWQGYETTEKVDAVEVVYWDKDKSFNRSSAIAKSTTYESLTRQPRTAVLEMRGINSYNQAIREATFRIQKTEMITRYGTLKTILPGIICEIGDVVEIVHNTNKFGYGGRVRQDHSSASTILIDQSINMPAASFSGKAEIYLIDPDGVLRTHSILGPFDEDTDEIEIDGSYTGYRFDTFAIGRPNDEKLLYQIVGRIVTPANKEESGYVLNIDFVEYVDAIFYNSSFGSGGTVAL